MSSSRPVQLPLMYQGAASHEGPILNPAIDTSFPEQEANALAALESFNKHLYRPNTYLHKWWARRSGTTFRYLLKQLVADPRKREFLEPGGLEGIVILDPLMGGGTTLHEAIRMGANCVGVDVDPIPVLQVRASLQYESTASKRQIYQWFEAALRQQLAPFFTTRCPTCHESSEVQYTLYALRRRCKCREVAILDSLTLREDPVQPVSVCQVCQVVFNGEQHKCHPTKEPGSMSLIERTQAACFSCGATFEDILDIPFWQRYMPMVIVGRCDRHGTFHKRADEWDMVRIQQANDMLANTTCLDPAHFLIPNGPKSKDLLTHGVPSYLDLFTRRQLLFLERAIQLVKASPQRHRLWLALLVSTSLEFNALLCGYKGAQIRRPGAIRHVFSHHAYSFPYTALENNPLFSGNTSGTLGRLFRDRIEKANEWASAPVERYVRAGKVRTVRINGEVDGGELARSLSEFAQGIRRFYLIQSDFRACDIPEDFVDYVVTDPPYYDSVQYSDLSTFFRVWLCQLLPQEADWMYDPRLSAVAEDASKGEAYGNALTSIWQKCHKALKKPHGRLIFTFHHWSPRAWAELTLSLRRAGFVLTNRYVVLSENPISVHIRNLRALKHDCILVLKPRSEHEEGSWPVPKQVNLSDSQLFCLDCGSTLGSFLQSEMGEAEIRQSWQVLLGVNGNGETSR